MVLEDAALLQETHQMVRDNGCNVEHAYWYFEKYARAFEAMEDDYLRERAVDLRDVSQRVLTQLMGQQDDMRLYQLKVPSIVVGHDLTPSMTAMLDRNMVLGFATDVEAKLPTRPSLPAHSRSQRSWAYTISASNCAKMILFF